MHYVGANRYETPKIIHFESARYETAFFSGVAGIFGDLVARINRTPMIIHLKSVLENAAF